MADVPGGYVVLEKSARHARSGAKLKGAADPHEELTVSVRVRRRPGAPPLPDVTHGGRRLTREQFAETYGAAENDLDAVARFGQEHGLVETERSIPRRTVVLSGTVQSAGEAFAVDLGTYKSNAETYRGREGDIHVPVALKDVVEGVFGLDNRRMAQRAATGSRTAATGTRTAADKRTTAAAGKRTTAAAGKSTGKRPAAGTRARNGAGNGAGAGKITPRRTRPSTSPVTPPKWPACTDSRPASTARGRRSG